MANRKYLVVNVSYRSEDRINFVSSNYRLVLSNIDRAELDNYLNQLDGEGWVLIRIDSESDGLEKAYWFYRNTEQG